MRTGFITTLRAQDADRERRDVRVCACGGEYEDTADGRRRHQMLHGHRPTRDAS